MKQILTFVPEQGHYRVNGNNLCSLPKGDIVWTIDNYSTGGGHSAHSNIDASGSVSGMEKLGYWRNTYRTLRHKVFIYNMSKIACSDLLVELCLAIEECRCHQEYTSVEQGKHILFTFETERNYA